MAEDQVRTRITADADFSNLISDVHKVTASLSKLQEKIASSNKMLANQIAVMNRSFSDTLRSTGQFSTHFVSLNSDVEKFGKNLDSGQIKLNQYFRTMQTHTKTSGGVIRELAKQQVALQNAIIQPLGRNAQGLMQFNVQVPRGLDEVKNKTAIARQELQIMNKVVQQGAGQLINWGKNTQWAGRQLSVGLTLPIAAFGKAAADAFKTADQELVRLTKVYGDTAGSTAAELGKIRSEVEATAKSLAKNLGASYRETLALGADIAATGQTGQKLIASIEETTRLAVLGEVDRAEAMKATLAIQSAFKQNTEELTESINFLNAVENQTSTSLADLVEAIPKAGPVIQGLGGSVQDLALYLTAMREGGINASEGANALKSGLASLINPTKVAVGQFKEFGIDLLGIVNENAGSTTDMIIALQEALDRLDPLKKQQAIENLFGKFQFARMNALFENLGKQGSQTLQVLDLMRASTKDLGALADRELAQVTESASGRYNRAVEGLKAELAIIGESFLNINTTLINVVTKIVDFVTNLPKPLKQVLTLFGGLTAVAGPLIMLTGVLANFFGYIVKGVFHMKALFKGGEGWKYLTPEILAAEKAGSLIEQTLYSDAKAAGVLQLALRNLIDEFSVLEAKAASGSISVAPAVRTMAGNMVQQAGAGARVVDKNHPLVGEPYTRSSSHMNPRGLMSETERLNQTFFGMVPGSTPVNQKISANPQIYAESDLPNIPGLTRINGTSTGVVAAEAAKWHAMMATLGMQSKQEIDSLKKSIASTGVATQQFMSIFDDVLPAVSNITRNAAIESRAIIAQLEAGAMNVQQARSEIIALNSRTEALIAETTMAQAQGMGRTLNPTMVPTLNQPVVTATGKSNMRELFKKSKTKDFIDKIARNLGVRTSGAGYNIETTIPKRLNAGGSVFLNNGDQVPGTGNSDTVPAMLTPGEFVIRKGVAQQDPDGMRALNNGQAMIVPVQGRNLGGLISRLTPRGRKLLATTEIQKNWRAVFGKHGGAPKSEYEPKGNAGVFGGHAESRNFSASTAKINKDMETIGVDPQVLLASINARGGGARTSTDVFLSGLAKSGIISKQEYRRISKKAFSAYAKKLLGMEKVTDPNNPLWSVSNEVLLKEFSNNPDALAFWQEYSRQPGGFGDPKYRSSSNYLNELTLNGKTANFASLKASGSNKFYHTKEEANPFISKLNSYFAANAGGMVPGYVTGGQIPWIRGGVSRQMESVWKKSFEKYPNGQKPTTYDPAGKPAGRYPMPKSYYQELRNDDPAHGPLQIGKYQPSLHVRNRYVAPMIRYRGGKGYEKEGTAAAFEVGNLESRAKTALFAYMQGDYSRINDPEVQKYLSTLRTKFTGTLHRGISNYGSLPPVIGDLIRQGKWSDLIGKEFIMRRSSWSKNPDTAKGFLGKEYGNVLMTANVKNRNAVPASDLFPDLTFQTPSGPVKVNESEVYMGGKFKVVSAEKGKIQVEAVYDAAREKGGPVNTGRPYLVGENGPEMFVPGSSGTIVPQSFKNGGGVKSAFQTGFQAGRTPGDGTRSEMGNQGMFAAGMGLQMGGMMAQGPVGTAMMASGTAMQMLPMLQMLTPALKQLKNITGMVSTFGRIAGVAFRIAGMAVKFFTGPIGIASLAIGGLVAGFKIWQKQIAETRREHAMLNGITSKGAAEAGINYETMTEKLKRVNAELKLQREKGLLSYEATTSSGVSGLTLTIAELKELKKTAKETMPELMGTFNSIDSSKVNDLAVNLKAQFVAGGMSVQDATNKIYALIEASNKAGQGFDAISQKGFQQIIDKSSAASFTIKSLAKNIEDLTNGTSKVDSAAFAGNVDSVIASLDSAVQSLVGTKDATGEKITETKALQMQYQKLIDLGVQEKQIGKEALENLKKERPELASILKSTDTIGGMYAKWRLTLAGVQVDLRNINSETAIGMAMYQDALALAGEQISSGKVSSKTLGKASEASNKLGKEIKAGADLVKKASKEQAGLDRAAIKRINDKIAAIKKEADAKKKAMSEALDSENTELELQKLQLESQAALARGDRDAYAQAQLSIAQLTKETHAKKAMARVDALENKAVEEQQKLLEDDAEKKAKQEDKITQFTKSGESKATTKEQIDGFMSRLLSLAARQDTANKIKDPAARKKETDIITGDRDTILSELEKASNAVQEKFTEFVDPKTNKRLLDKTVPFPMKNAGERVGGATSAFNDLVKEVSSQANLNYKSMVKDLGGGATLKDVVIAMGGSIGSTKKLTTADVLSATGSKDINSAKKGKAAGTSQGDLTDDAREDIIDKFKLEEGDTFDYEGRTYVVKRGESGWMRSRAVKRAGGGRFVPGQTYTVNDGMKTEGIKFDMPGTIYPNINTSPNYNIPSSSINGMRGMSNTSSSNSVYNVNIELNGTNLSVDDVMRRFKQELQVIGAKEGRVRTVGGYN